MQLCKVMALLVGILNPVVQAFLPPIAGAIPSEFDLYTLRSKLARMKPSALRAEAINRGVEATLLDSVLDSSSSIQEIKRAYTKLITEALKPPDGNVESMGCADSPDESHKYCIVGAGPAGVQLGAFLLAKDRDYVILEKEPFSGSFFAKYPVHRKLISVNKRNTRSMNDEFNYRHDWNSLLGAGCDNQTSSTCKPKSGMFSDHSQEYWPDADDLHAYIDEFAQNQVAAQKIRYNTDVKLIKRNGPQSYSLTLENRCMQQYQLSCEVVVVATGLAAPSKPTDTFDRLNDLAIGYEDLAPWNPAEFTGKRMLILGMGNAAFETADAVRNEAAEMTIFGRRQEQLLAKDTHYVGHLRAHRTAALESVNLKSLDEVWYYPTPTRLVVVKCGEPDPDSSAGLRANYSMPNTHADRSRHQIYEGIDMIMDHNGGFRGQAPLCIFEKQFPEGPKYLNDPSGRNSWGDPDNLVTLAAWQTDNSNPPAVEKMLQSFPDQVSITNTTPALLRRQYQHLAEFYRQIDKRLPGGVDESLSADMLDERALNIQTVVCSVRDLISLSESDQLFRALLPSLLQTTKGLTATAARFRKPFDVIIRCFGWNLDRSIFDNATIDIPGHPMSPKKYPHVNGKGEVATVQSTDGKAYQSNGLYFLGSVAHGADKHRFASAGGFVHGFRYLARSLSHILDHKFEGEEFWADQRTIFPWKNSVVPTSTLLSQWPELWQKLVMRINEASGPYQMSCLAFVDAIVYNKTNKSATYFEDLPHDVATEDLSDSPRLVWGFRYGSPAKNGPVPSVLAKIPWGNPDGIDSQEAAISAIFIHPVLIYLPPGVTSTGDQEARRMHLHHCRWTDWSAEQDLAAIKDFVQEVEKTVVESTSENGATMQRLFHTNLEIWREGCFKTNYLHDSERQHLRSAVVRDSRGFATPGVEYARALKVQDDSMWAKYVAETSADDTISDQMKRELGVPMPQQQQKMPQQQQKMPQQQRKNQNKKSGRKARARKSGRKARAE